MFGTAHHTMSENCARVFSGKRSLYVAVKKRYESETNIIMTI